MPRRKSDDTAPPTEPAKPGHDPSLTWRPLVMSRWVAPNTPSTGSAEPDAPPPDDSPLSDSSWKKVDEELGRRIRGIGPQYVGLPPWSHRALQAAKARIQSSPASLTRREKERFDFLRQWQRQEIEDAAARRERAIEPTRAILFLLREICRRKGAGLEAISSRENGVTKEGP